MPKMTVYTMPTCHWCHQLKDFLDSKGIKYTDIDVSVDREKAEEMVEKTGQMGVPVSEIDGEYVIGFDQEKIKKLLNIK
jgi:glutaredoxin 3